MAGAGWDTFVPDAKPTPAAATPAASGWEGFTPESDSPNKKLVRKMVEGAGNLANKVGPAIGAGLDILGGAPAEGSITGKGVEPPPLKGREAAQKAESSVIDPAGFVAGASLGSYGSLPGAMIGAGAGAVAADQADQYINNYLYGDTIYPLSSPSASKFKPADWMFNRPYGRADKIATSAALMELGGRAAPSALAGLFGLNTAAKEAQEAYAAQTTENEAQVKTLGHSSAEGLQKVAREKWELEQEAREKAKTRTETEVSKVNADKVKAAKEQESAAQLAEKQQALHEQEQARGKLIGRTREESATALAHEPVVPEPGVAVPSEAELERKMATRGTIFDEAEKTQKFYGKKYDTFEKTYGDKVIPKDKLSMEGMTDAESQGRLNDVLNEIKRRSAKVGEPMELSQPLKDLIKDAQKVAGGRSVVARTSEVDPVSGQPALEDLGAEQGPTVSVMRQLAQKAQQTSKGLRTTAEKDMADLIHDGAMRSLEGANDVPGDAIKDLKNTNTYYRDFRETFSNSFLAKVASNPEPTNLYEDIFNNPSRANRLLAAAVAPQQKVLQNLAADYWNKNGWSLQKIADEVGPTGVGKNLYGDKAWNDAISVLPKAETIVDKVKAAVATSPATDREFGAEFQNHYNEIRWDKFEKERADAMSVLKQMGPAGDAMREKFRNAMTPEKMDQVGAELANMKPEDFIKALKSTQRTPLTSAREAVMTGKTSDTIRALQRFTRFRSMFYSAALTGGALGGHVPPTMAGLAAITAAMGVPVAGNYAGRAVLRNPALAEIMADIATNAGKLNTVKYVARRAGDLIAAMADEKVKERMDKEPTITP